jgi:PIN domain nuclease of toxin-antitoxin system
MRFILDTHTFLWYIQDDPKLSIRAATLLENAENEVVLSVASLLEIAIKVSTGKLSIGSPMSQFVAEKIEALDIEQLPILPSHLDILMTLPFHHRDPFDRLIGRLRLGAMLMA